MNNKDIYESKGYTFTKCGDIFLVDANDLSNTSTKKIKTKCDRCGTIKKIGYGKYCENVERNGKYICHKCSTQIKHDKTLEVRQQKYYIQLLDACALLGYKLISNINDIKTNTSYIQYECPKHGIQSMRINNLLNGRKCPCCCHEQHSEQYRLDIETVLQRVDECHGKLLNPEEYVNRTKSNLLFECPKCGKSFYSSLQHFTQHGGQVCKECQGSESIGEFTIRSFLELNNIQYIQEKWFDDCRDINPLPFDFYLPEYNLIIEFDGKQHYVDNKFFGYSTEKTQQHDEIKNNYCKDKGIDLLRIPYTKIYQINDILKNKLLT